MAFTLTENATVASESQSIELNIVFEIEGVDTIFGAVGVRKYVRVGDTDLIIGTPPAANTFYVGGFNLVEDQESLVSLDGTTTKIQQQLQIEKGKSSGVPNFQVRLVDKDEVVTELITPDETVSPAFDILGRRCKIKLGFLNTSFPDDYITIFRGVISEIEPGAGYVNFSINSPDNKKRKTIFKQATCELTANMTNVATTATVDQTTNFLTKINAPGSGSPSANFETYIRIDDEIIKYTAKTGTTFTGLTRGQFGTTAVSHSSGATVDSIYGITGNPLDIALQVMLSGWGSAFVEDLSIDSFNVVSPTDIQPNTIIFKETDLDDLTGVQVGDFITTTGATNGANNVSVKEITGIERNEDGHTILTIDAVTFVNEPTTSAVMSIRSQYDTFPAGMKMTGDEVDIAQHLFIKNTFAPSFEYDFRLTETIEDGKEWLEEQVYSPIAAFSIPRKSRSSVGIHTGPVPGQDIKKLDNTNVKNPSRLKIKRSTEKYFYNEVIYRYDKNAITDKYNAGTIVINQDSKDRIANKEKALIINADGIRSILSGETLSQSAAERRLSRYKFGAETIQVEPFFGKSFQLEIGDIVLFDGAELKVADIKNGSRDFVPRLMDIDQKTMDIKSGVVTLNLVDTNFAGQSRFGLISPSSIIQTGLSTTQFVIQPSYGSIKHGSNEYRKYENIIQPKVRIRNADFSVTANATIDNFSGNTVTLTAPIAFTPSAGYVMELQDYSAQPIEVNLVYAFISDGIGIDFADSTDTYVIF